MPRTPVTIPAEPVRQHLQSLLDQGWTQTRIAEKAGYSKQMIHNVYRHNQRVDRLVAEDLLSLKVAA